MYCQKCGRSINDEATFCKFCGTKLSGMSENTSSDKSDGDVEVFHIASRYKHYNDREPKNYKPLIIVAVLVVILLIVCITSINSKGGGGIPSGTYYGTSMWNDGTKIVINGDRFTIGALRSESGLKYTYKLQGDKLILYDESGKESSTCSFSRKGDCIYVNGEEYEKR